MNSAKVAVTGLIVTLVAFVVAVPVLGALFSDGGSFDQLEEVVSGRTIVTTSNDGCRYTPDPSFTPPSSLTRPGGVAIITGSTPDAPTEPGLPSNIVLTSLPSAGVVVPAGTQPEGATVALTVRAFHSNVETVFYINDGGTRYLVAYSGALASSSPLSTNPYRTGMACASSPATSVAAQSITSAYPGSPAGCRYRAHSTRSAYPSGVEAALRTPPSNTSWAYVDDSSPGLLVSAGSNAATELLTSPVSVGAFNVDRVFYFAITTGGSTVRHVVGYGHSSTPWPSNRNCSSSVTTRTASAPNVYTHYSSVAYVAAIAAAPFGNALAAYSAAILPGTTFEPTAISNSPYAPILTAIFGLIPLGLLLAVGWYFIGQRMMSSGGGRRRGGRRR